MVKTAKYITVAITAVLFYGISVRPSLAQTLNLLPQTATKTVGEEFTVDLNIDTVGKAAMGTDVVMTFDTDFIEVVSITNQKARKDAGGFFTDGSYNLTGNNIYIASYFSAQFETETGTGKIATFKLKGKKVGTGQMIFACTSQGNDTNILDATAGDIANCTAIKNGSYTFVAGSSTSPTNTPAPGVPTATPTIPVSGTSLPTYITFGFGAFLAVIGLAFLF